MEKDGGREKDQMGRGGTEPRRAVIKTRGKKKCDKREKGNERGIKCWRERVGVVRDSGFERGAFV